MVLAKNVRQKVRAWQLGLCGHGCKATVHDKKMPQVRRLIRDDSGQAVVELVIALPIMLTIALIGINAGLFFEKCASFDWMFSQTARVCAAAPCNKETQSALCSNIEQKLNNYYQDAGVSVQVSASADAQGCTIYTATMEMEPTFFGFSFNNGILCATFPPLRHQTSLALSVYKPGVLV